MIKSVKLILTALLATLAFISAAQAQTDIEKARANLETQIKDLPEADKVKARKNFDRLVAQAGGKAAPTEAPTAGTPGQSAATPAIDPAAALALAGSIYGAAQSSGLDGRGRYVSESEKARLAQQVLRGMAEGNKDSTALLTASETVLAHVGPNGPDVAGLVSAAAANPNLIQGVANGVKSVGSAISGGLGKFFGGKKAEAAEAAPATAPVTAVK